MPVRPLALTPAKFLLDSPHGLHGSVHCVGFYFISQLFVMSHSTSGHALPFHSIENAWHWDRPQAPPLARFLHRPVASAGSATQQKAQLPEDKVWAGANEQRRPFWRQNLEEF